MGIGKIFIGLSIIVGWLVVKFGIIESKTGLSVFISEPGARFAFVESFHGIEPVLWIFVILAGFGIILMGARGD